MKNKIKLTESQLKKVINKIIREELINELDDRTMQNAILKTKHTANRQGQYQGMLKNYGDRYFQQFIGKKLFKYEIIGVDINIGDKDPDFDQKDISDVNFNKSEDFMSYSS